MKSGFAEELVFLKLGGSLITDKAREATARLEVIERLAGEIKGALEARPSLRLVLGHGSGSFGHFAGRRYGVREGVKGPEGWKGFAETAAAAARLNRIVTDVLLAKGVPVLSLQPSASLLCHDGSIVRWVWEPVKVALEKGLVPLVYGDVALDEVRGTTIVSTEELFCYLAEKMRPRRILLAGEVEGVFTSDPLKDPAARLVPEITPAEVGKIQEFLSGSYGIDVTGGMAQKVRLMLRLVQKLPDITVLIISGQKPGNVRDALLSLQPLRCTVISSI